MLAIPFRRLDGLQNRPPRGGWRRARGGPGGRQGPEGGRDSVRPLIRSRPLPLRRTALPRYGRRMAGWRVRVVQGRGRDPTRSRRAAGGGPPERRDRGRRRGLRPSVRTGPVLERASHETLSERSTQDPRRVQAGVGTGEGGLCHRPGKYGGAGHADPRLPGPRRRQGTRGRQPRDHAERGRARDPIRVRALEATEWSAVGSEAAGDVRGQVKRHGEVQALPPSLRRGRRPLSDDPERKPPQRPAPASAPPRPPRPPRGPYHPPG